MDSLTQIALGSAVSLAAMGRRTTAWKAALWGAVAGTLPDLDALIDHGDPIANMVLHRADSHALLYLSLLAPFLGGLAARLHGESIQWKRWWLALWLALVTHPLLDWMTVYGTQLLRPFTDHPYGVGSIFIIDPLYTVPLIVGVVAALAVSGRRGLRWNTAGLWLSTAYLSWGFAVQQHVAGIARTSLEAIGCPASEVLVTPTPFNTLAWRVVAMVPGQYAEGFYALADGRRPIHFTLHDRGEALIAQLGARTPVRRVAAFSHGFYRMREQGGHVQITDLRMGQEPAYTFHFDLGTPADLAAGRATVVQTWQRPDAATALPALGRRILGEGGGDGIFGTASRP
ncbi:metal-dependent hydrolase [Paracidovorax cattleyae]|uniref:Inner membrane protein n=1 Tax=Paracidovorax cattleyae TaxID=80868 RepID=A0A1H0M202_9BURK|nr:metal-dependent hydrolase [Paracidovorax cattleyae]AVS74257.1 metal-dependent hydrolase [Paracidovorax cattleyae]SDO74246.1 inner membrane protein [Paracidovorax cattleyae]